MNTPQPKNKKNKSPSLNLWAKALASGNLALAGVPDGAQWEGPLDQAIAANPNPICFGKHTLAAHLIQKQLALRPDDFLDYSKLRHAMEQNSRPLSDQAHAESALACQKEHQRLARAAACALDSRLRHWNNPDARAPGGGADLIAACRIANAGICQTLLSYGADPLLADPSGIAPLMALAQAPEEFPEHAARLRIAEAIGEALAKELGAAQPAPGRKKLAALSLFSAGLFDSACRICPAQNIESLFLACPEPDFALSSPADFDRLSNACMAMPSKALAAGPARALSAALLGDKPFFCGEGQSLAAGILADIALRRGWIFGREQTCALFDHCIGQLSLDPDDENAERFILAALRSAPKDWILHPGPVKTINADGREISFDGSKTVALALCGHARFLDELPGLGYPIPEPEQIEACAKQAEQRWLAQAQHGRFAILAQARAAEFLAEFSGASRQAQCLSEQASFRRHLDDAAPPAAAAARNKSI